MSTQLREAKIGDRVRFIDAPQRVGEIVGEHDGAAIVYWGTWNAQRLTTIEVLGDPRSRCELAV